MVLVSAPVQGDAAPGLVARAIRHLDARPDVDVIVVARGGGSLEDLMAFNSEVVCRAVGAATTPIVSAVGHERDVTLCDLVADVRVLTPTAAAAAVVPSLEALETRLGDASEAIRRGLSRARVEAAVALRRRERDLVRALRASGTRWVVTAWRGWRPVSTPRWRAPPRVPRRWWTPAPWPCGGRWRRAGRWPAGRVERASALLALLSPERTVARGYAIVRDGVDGAVIGSAAAIETGQDLSIRLRDGVVAARAEGVTHVSATDARGRRGPGDLRGGPAPPGRGRRAPRERRGGPGGGGGAVRAGPGLPRGLS